jgi:predicted transcriptional regulator
MTIRRYRTKTEILAEFLQAASVHNGISRTHLMYNTFVPHRQVKEYLRVVVQNGLLDYDGLTRIYKTTEKGLNVIELCEKLQELTTAYY